MASPRLKDKLQQVRQAAILDAVNRLLASKGFEQMTVDEVAAEVGIAKTSLYRHYASKEALAAAAMARVLEDTLECLDRLALDHPDQPLAALQGLTRWAVGRLLAGQMPSLPSQNSQLRQALADDPHYGRLLGEVAGRMEEWILSAQSRGQLRTDLPPELHLYSLFARACDPVVTVLKASGQYADEQITDWVLRSCFDGLATPVSSFPTH
ncbi:TetR/AcrR family transcriptional regulator [Ideonella livida]|uniref:TetR/AcrR family transcriptional regulator n=1 Tax=Ideonella livida TaxID=2707176 RepID=A0A7C9PFF2_9BURK|nr:TetR/AcrR family transcriptional regulator [Ideonella livida]NDY90577.1 TetR/AcrR family transcriptional regulator [Ideonella livida]